METLDENLEKIDDVELIDDSNNDDILVDETEEKKENNIFDTVIDVNDEEALLDEENWNGETFSYNGRSFLLQFGYNLDIFKEIM